MQSYKEEAEEVASSQPTIAEVKQAWIEGAQDTVGLQRLKGILGQSYSELVPGCSAGILRASGLRTIHEWARDVKAA